MPPAMSGLDRYDARPCGTRATMPAKMMKLMPLPMPRSVISSPIHMASTVPAASVTIWRDRRQAQDVEVGDDALRRQDGEVAIGLQQRERHGQVARVLVDLGPAVLAFARSACRRGTTPVMSCMMIEALMYGLTPIATIENERRPPPENRSSSCRNCCCSTRFGDGVAVDRRHRHDGQRPIDDEHAEHEQDAPADVRRAECVDQRLEHALEPSTCSWLVRRVSVTRLRALRRSRRSWPRGGEAWPRLFAVGCGRQFRGAAASLARGLRTSRRLPASARDASASARPARPWRGSAGAAARRFSSSAPALSSRRPGGRLAPPRARSRPRSWTKPPASSILRRALALNASAATKSFWLTSPWPRTLSGLSSPRIRPALASTSALTVTTGWSDALPLALGCSASTPKRPASA